jgi:hypothetical protein
VNLVSLGAGLVVLVPAVALICLATVAFVGAPPVRIITISWRPLIIGALLLVLPLLVRSDNVAMLVSLQLAAGLVILIGLARLRSSQSLNPQHVALGILVATTLLAFISVLEILGTSARLPIPDLGSGTADRAAGWLSHPNLWGLTGIIPAIFLFSLPRQLPLAFLNLVPTLTVVISSASRVAAAALALGILGLVLSRALPRYRALTIIATLLSLTVGSLLLSHNAWLLRFNPFFDYRNSPNLLRASEDLGYGAWSQLHITAYPSWSSILLGSLKREWTLEKTGNFWWARAKQSVPLQPGGYYTWRSELKSGTPGAVIGVHGISEGDEYVFLNAYRSPDGQWELESAGAIADARLRIVQMQGSWTRLQITFRYVGVQRVALHIGPTPDQRRSDSHALLQVRGMQVTQDEIGQNYWPTFAQGADRRASLGTMQGRRSYISTALAGWVSRPIFGWGTGNFEALANGRASGESAGASHAHNLFAHTLFERGLVGFAGLLLLLWGLVRTARHSWWALGIIALVLLVNLLDYSFWSAAVFYPLFAVTGWFAETTGAAHGNVEGLTGTRGSNV